MRGLLNIRVSTNTIILCNIQILTEQFMEFDENNSGDIGEFIISQ